MDLISKINQYESGMLSEVEEIELFSYLIKTGMAWKFQGHYGRTAKSYIDNEVISKKGKILIDLNDIF